MSTDNETENNFEESSQGDDQIETRKFQTPSEGNHTRLVSDTTTMVGAASTSTYTASPPQKLLWGVDLDQPIAAEWTPRRKLRKVPGRYNLRRNTVGLADCEGVEEVAPTVEEAIIDFVKPKSVLDNQEGPESTEEMVWEVVLQSIEVSHKNEIAELRDEHADQVGYLEKDLQKTRAQKTLLQKRVKKEVEAKNGSETQRKQLEESLRAKEEELANLLQAHENLQVHFDELQNSTASKTRALQEKEVQLKAKDGQMMELRNRLHITSKDLDNSLRDNEQMRCHLQSGSGSFIHPNLHEGYSIHNDNQCRVVQERNQVLQRELDQAITMSTNMAMTIAQCRRDAEYYMWKAAQLRGIMDGDKSGAGEADQLIAAKNEQFRQLEERAGASFTQLSKLEHQVELNKAIIRHLRGELERQVAASQSLQARKVVFQNSNTDILNMLTARVYRDNLIKAMSDEFDIVRKDNSILAAGATDMDSELKKSREDQLVSEVRNLEASRELKELAEELSECRDAKRALEVDNGRLEFHLELIGDEHNDAIAAKDSRITELESSVEGLEADLSFLNRLDIQDHARLYIGRKDETIANLRLCLGSANAQVVTCREREAARLWIEGTEEYAGYLKEQTDQLLKDQLASAEAEVETLRKKCGALSACELVVDNRVVKAEDKAKALEIKLRMEVSRSVHDLQLQQRIQTETEERVDAIRELGIQLWVRVRQLEETLKINGRCIIEDKEERAKLMQECQALLNVHEDKNGNTSDYSPDNASESGKVNDEAIPSHQIQNGAQDMYADAVHENQAAAEIGTSIDEATEKGMTLGKDMADNSESVCGEAVGDEADNTSEGESIEADVDASYYAKALQLIAEADRTEGHGIAAEGHPEVEAGIEEDEGSEAASEASTIILAPRAAFNTIDEDNEGPGDIAPSTVPESTKRSTLLDNEWTRKHKPFMYGEPVEDDIF